MAVTKLIQKQVEIGAREITFNDDTKMAEIHYYQYEGGIATAFESTQVVSFEDMYKANPDAFDACINAIQIMSDYYNSETYVAPVEEVVEPESETIVEEGI